MVSITLGEWLLQILSTVVLFLILKRLLFAKVKDVINKREELIKQNIDDAQRANDHANENKAKYEAIIKKADIEAQDIIRAATKRGEERKDEIIKEAHEEAKKIIARAQLDVERGKEKAIEEVKAEIIDIAIYAASKALEKDLDDAGHRSLIGQFVDKAGEA